MIRALILYYLNIKSTHGYEIQKFIQLNHMDKWTKIQSGSIYYALNKLEKQGCIVLESESGTGAKARKTYGITEKGKLELNELVQQELDKDIVSTGSDKFVIYPILNTLDQNVMQEKIKSHIAHLEEKLDYFAKWQEAKIDKNSLKIEALSFEMMISSTEYQIKWHEALLEEMEKCILSSNQVSDLIARFDFSKFESTEKPYIGAGRSTKCIFSTTEKE